MGVIPKAPTTVNWFLIIELAKHAVVLVQILSNHFESIIVICQFLLEMRVAIRHFRQSELLGIGTGYLYLGTTTCDYRTLESDFVK